MLGAYQSIIKNRWATFASVSNLTTGNILVKRLRQNIGFLCERKWVQLPYREEFSKWEHHYVRVSEDTLIRLSTGVGLLCYQLPKTGAGINPHIVCWLLGKECFLSILVPYSIWESIWTVQSARSCCRVKYRFVRYRNLSFSTAGNHGNKFRTRDFTGKDLL